MGKMRHLSRLLVFFLSTSSFLSCNRHQRIVELLRFSFLKEKGESEKAIDIYKKSFRAHSSFTLALSYASLLLEKDRHEEILKVTKEGCLRNYKLGLLHAQALFLTGKPEQAETMYEKLHRRFCLAPEVIVQRSLHTHFNLNDTKRAIIYLEKFPHEICAQPEKSAHLYVVKAQILASTGNIKEALDSCDAALELYPHMGEASFLKKHLEKFLVSTENNHKTT